VFRGLINDAKSKVSSVILGYVAKASVAVPFVIAGGFALAAGTMMLVERYGALFAYWTMAGGLAAVGLIAALVVRGKEQEEEAADEKAEAADTAEVAAEVAAQAPLALMGGLFALPGGPGTVLKIAKVLGNNYALVLLLVVVGTLLWPTNEDKPEVHADKTDPPPIPPENIEAFNQESDTRQGTRAWAAVAIISVGIAATGASAFLVDPMWAKHAVMVGLGWLRG
jgi:hypothetical protein